MPASPHTIAPILPGIFAAIATWSAVADLRKRRRS